MSEILKASCQCTPPALKNCPCFICAQNKSIEALEAERDRLKAELDTALIEWRRFEGEWLEESRLRKQAESRAERLAEALRKIRDELGVPQPNYPAPVTNAANYAKDSLAAYTASVKEIK